jgi:hypothetical protein
MLRKAAQASKVTFFSCNVLALCIASFVPVSIMLLDLRVEKIFLFRPKVVLLKAA